RVEKNFGMTDPFVSIITSKRELIFFSFLSFFFISYQFTLSLAAYKAWLAQAVRSSVWYARGFEFDCNGCWVGDHQWIQWGEDETSRREIAAVRTNNGTFPPKSQWTKNPIPACVGQTGGFLDPHQCLMGRQFPASGPGLSGFGINLYGTEKIFPFSIVDLVKVPEDLDVGEYVLSFRWDTEQGHQVWNKCASIHVE
uniref:Uncharacterized protein n=1 Tax=Clytia hemisphaerica TaxID=252671 RepID=A0A7M5UC32_9CNID